VNKSISEIENEIIEEFSTLGDWLDKYEYIIELGKNLPLIEEAHKTDEYKVPGCQSRVWLKAFYKNGKVYYKADSDATITKGLISLLIRVLSGQTPEQIMNAKLEFIDKIGMREHLSSTRANGLVSMISEMKNHACLVNEECRKKRGLTDKKL